MAGRFTFFRSYYESLKELEPKDFKAVLCAICAYAFDGEEVELKGIQKSIYALIKPNVERSCEIAEKRAASGRKGAEKTNQQKRGKRSAKERQTDGKKVTQTALVQESELSEPLKEKLIEWLKYKAERREGYKETGLKSLITEVHRHEQESGSRAVIGLINECMANGWRGIIWDKLEKAKPERNALDSWLEGEE